MKRFFYTTIIITAFSLLYGCNGIKSKAEDRAEAICDCMQDAGLTDMASLYSNGPFGFSPRMLDDKFTTEMPSCILKVLKEMDEDLDGLGKKEQKAYTREFMKACVDTECMDKVLEFVPYDNFGTMVDEYEERVERQQKYMNKMNDVMEELEAVPEMEDLEELQDLLEDLE